MAAAALCFEKSRYENSLDTARLRRLLLSQKHSGLTIKRGTSSRTLARLARLLACIADEKREEIRLMSEIETVLRRIARRRAERHLRAAARAGETPAPVRKRRRNPALAALLAYLWARMLTPQTPAGPA